MTDKLQDRSGIQNVAPTKNMAWSLDLFLFHLESVMYMKLFIWLRFILRHSIILDSKNMVLRMKVWHYK